MLRCNQGTNKSLYFCISVPFGIIWIIVKMQLAQSSLRVSTYILLGLLHMNVVAPNDSMAILVEGRLPAHSDAGRIDWLNRDVLWVTRHCMMYKSCYTQHWHTSSGHSCLSSRTHTLSPTHTHAGKLCQAKSCVRHHAMLKLADILLEEALVNNKKKMVSQIRMKK
jgi:hypothetical protein